MIQMSSGVGLKRMEGSNRQWGSSVDSPDLMHKKKR